MAADLRGTLRRPWVGYVAIGLGASVAYFLLPDVQDLLYLLIGFSAAWAIIAGRRINGPTHRGWPILAAGIVLYGLGDVVYTILAATTGEEPFPSLADGPYLLGQLLVVVGVGRLAVRPRLRRGPTRWAFITAILRCVARQRIPVDVLAAAHERARAREARDWPEADRLRAMIEAAGWKIVDRGTDFALSPAAPPDVADQQRVRYGASRNVPSRLDEAPGGLATVILIATDWPGDLDRALTSLRATSPAGTSVVVVADGPSAEQEAALDNLEVDILVEVPLEIVWTSERLGHGAALNAGIRRASGPIAILLDTSVEASGDFVTPLAQALDDPTVAVAGGWGIVSKDLRRFEDAPAGDVDAIEGYCLAFRRSDYARRGPVDERFTFYRNLDIWWSLVLRDEGEGRPPRRAVALDGLPLVRHEHRGYTSLPDAERDRLSKRNFYRIIDRFGSRRDLLVRPG
jgi:hypothetical protein